MNESINSVDIISRIFFVRGTNVMLDFDLSSLYQVENRALKQQVKRNIDRFPEDFMFQLSKDEWQELITNCDKLGALKFSPATPYAFTEQGIAMLSGVLHSKAAITVNVTIMRAFVKMRELFDENKELKKRLDEMEIHYDRQFRVVFDAIRQLIEKKNKPLPPIGFKTGKQS